MTTARDLIKSSMRAIHALESGEEPEGPEADDGLEIYNAMLDAFSNERLMVYATRQDDVTWSAGEESQTIGSGGDFDITRPIRLDDATFYTDDNGNDNPLRLLQSRQAYTQIVDKETESTQPMYLYYETSYPLGTLYIWMPPSSNLSVHLVSWQQLTRFTGLSDTVSLPPGYEELLKYNAAVRMAPEFGVSVPPEVMMLAKASRSRLESVNAPSVIMQTDMGLAGNRYNIFSDTYNP